MPRRLQHPKRRTIGIRVPQNRIALAILAGLGQPLMNVSLILPGEKLPMTEISAIQDRLGTQVELIIDGGHCGVEPTTVVDLTSGTPEVIREGRGDLEMD